MYDRKFESKTLNFEPSGALWQASLVMRDRETGSWWSIMKGEAIGGEFEGKALTELPLGEKVQWGHWSASHPQTLVLSVEGRQHVERNPYDEYFDSADPFRGFDPVDSRLPAKEPIFAFKFGGKAYAAPFRTIIGGRVVSVAGGARVLLHRTADAPLLRSTRAFQIVGEFAADAADLEAAAENPDRYPEILTPLAGFDTYWYTWSGVNPQVVIVD